MIQDKILKSVQSGLQHVPKPVVAAMRTKTAGMYCVVLGGAFTAYGKGYASGSEAIAGVAIGLTVATVQGLPLGKIFSGALSLVKRK